MTGIGESMFAREPTPIGEKGDEGDGRKGESTPTYRQLPINRDASNGFQIHATTKLEFAPWKKNPGAYFFVACEN
jgi:hypothetical protein